MKLECGCDTDEFNQPYVRCQTCNVDVVWPFGVGHDWVGICECKNVVYRWKAHESKIEKCVLVKKGCGTFFQWSDVKSTVPG